MTVALTVYGQLIVKREVTEAGAFPDGFRPRADYVLHLLLNRWVLSAFAAAGVAAVSYMIALSYLDLSRAYLMVSVSFAAVVILSSVVFDEPLTRYKLIGALLIGAGVVVGTQT